MSPAPIIAAWLLGSVIGFWIFTSVWRNEWDLKRSDAALFAVLALATGPIAPWCGLMVWWIERPKSDRTDRVLLREKSTLSAGVTKLEADRTADKGN